MCALSGIPAVVVLFSVLAMVSAVTQGQPEVALNHQDHPS